MADEYPKVYAEKILYLKEGRYSPMHFHWFKTGDIISRGGGNVLIRVYNSNPDESINYETDVRPHLYCARRNPGPADPRREHPHPAVYVS